jgi:hypothetical protein
MKWILFLAVFILTAAEYDCIIVSSSPVPLFEALYQRALGKKVLILEGSPSFGGAWQPISICGICRADLGCHTIGKNRELADFLEQYGGCTMISMNDGYYFSHGCHELIQNLLHLIESASIEIRADAQVESVKVEEREVSVLTNGKTYTTQKLFITPHIFFQLNGAGSIPKKAKFHHLYLLISDPTPSRFSYSHGLPGSTRMMNISQFAQLNPGEQLICIQTPRETSSEDGEAYLHALINKGFVDRAATLLCAEPYLYEQWPSRSLHFTTQDKQYIEVLDSQFTTDMIKHLPKWKERLRTYHEIVPQLPQG